MKKKLLAALMSAVMVVSLTACGGSAPASSGDAAPAADSGDDQLERQERLSRGPSPGPGRRRPHEAGHGRSLPGGGF